MERKKLPYWAYRVLAEREDGKLINPLGLVCTSESISASSPLIREGRIELHYSEMDGTDLVVNSIHYDGEFYGLEKMRMRFNRFNELEYESEDSDIPNVFHSNYRDFFIIGGDIQLIVFLQQAFVNMPFYKDLCDAGIFLRDTQVSNLYSMFLKKQHKIIPLLLQEKMYSCIQDIFNGKENNYELAEKKALKLCREHQIPLTNAIILCSRHNPQELDKFFRMTKYFGGVNATIASQIVKVPIDNLTKFGNYVVKNLFIYNKIKVSQFAFDFQVFCTTYSDYLRMTEGEERDLYPLDLDAAHDAAIDRMNARAAVEAQEKAMAQAEEFSKAAELYADLAWEDEESGIKVIVPMLPAELIEEGRQQHNCVGIYIASVIQKSSKILFARKDHKPYVTLEVQNSSIVQARRKCNEMPSEADEAWIMRFAKDKGLSVKSF